MKHSNLNLSKNGGGVVEWRVLTVAIVIGCLPVAAGRKKLNGRLRLPGIAAATSGAGARKSGPDRAAMGEQNPSPLLC